MNGKYFNSTIIALIMSILSSIASAQNAHNPIIWADVPDISIIRMGDTYYMSSTTMHMSPGTPIMKSKNLVNWEMASYAYETLGQQDFFELTNGQNAYGGGTWASSLRYYKGKYYASTFSNNSRKNYLFSTTDPEKAPWDAYTFEPMVHDHSLFFDDDDKIYIISCGGNVGIREMEADLSGIKSKENRIVIENADAITGKERMLPAEGAQMFKVNNKYYLFLITWPKNSMRTVLLYRSDNIWGPYEGRVVLEDKGVAQGGFVDTPEGNWYGYFFQDRGAVGRVPYLVPMQWVDGWPVFGENGIIPDTLDIQAVQPDIPAIIASDEFTREAGERDLPLVWQWNHNPDNRYWSLKERPGYLRLQTSRLTKSFTEAKNTLTQRTFGPVCSGEVAMEVAHMKNGDFAGIGLLQQKYGVVGVKMENGRKYVYVGNAQHSTRDNENYEELEVIPLNQNRVFLKVEADFKERADIGYFYYSTDGKDWKKIGQPLKMEYTLTHFMGYRFALFNYATQEAGGVVDFDYFRVGNTITTMHSTNW